MAKIDYYQPFSFLHFLSATISMHSFTVADHDRTTRESCGQKASGFFFFLSHSKNCKPLIFGKDRDWSEAKQHYYTIDQGKKVNEKERNCLKENSENRNREL